MTESGPLLLGVDLGSSGVTGTLVGPERDIVASASRAVALHRDHAGWAEADPTQWWRAACDVIGRLFAQAGVASSAVAALAVSGMAPAVVVCDEGGSPLRRAILHDDARAFGEIRELARALDHLDLVRLTGSVLSQQSVAPTVLWLSRHDPALWERAVSVQGSYDWLARRFGAAPHVEQNWALESGLYDLDLCPLASVPAATAIRWPDFLPVRRAGTVVGEVSVAAAAASGLVAGTAIVVGGASHVLSAYGAGLVRAGDALVTLGGAGDILAVSDSLFVDRRLYLDAHPRPGLWLPNGSMATSGPVLRWEQSLFGGVPLSVLDDEARGSRPGALVSLPYFMGEMTPLHDPDLRGVVAGLHLDSTRGDVHRSLLEGIAYGIKAHVDVFAENGLVLGEVRVVSGGSRSRLWCEILADVLHRDLSPIAHHRGASYGAAVLAGLGTGLIDGWDEVADTVAMGEVVAPRRENVARYEERYQQFRQLSAQTASVAHSLARDAP